MIKDTLPLEKTYQTENKKQQTKYIKPQKLEPMATVLDCCFGVSKERS